MRYPLVEIGEGGEIRLDRFVEETERTVFVSGAIALLGEGMPIGEGGEAELSLEEMSSLVSCLEGIRVVLPESV